MSSSTDIRHRLAMDGNLFMVGRRSVGQPAGSENDFLIKTGAKALLLSLEVAPEPGANFLVEFYEAPTITADGAATALCNMNRVSDRTLLTTCFSAPTVTAPGNLLFNCVGTVDLGSGGTHHNGLWVLAPNTKYLLRMTNTGGAAADCGYSLQMHELSL